MRHGNVAHGWGKCLEMIVKYSTDVELVAWLVPLVQTLDEMGEVVRRAIVAGEDSVAVIVGAIERGSQLKERHPLREVDVVRLALDFLPPVLDELVAAEERQLPAITLENALKEFVEIFKLFLELAFWQVVSIIAVRFINPRVETASRDVIVLVNRVGRDLVNSAV